MCIRDRHRKTKNTLPRCAVAPYKDCGDPSRPACHGCYVIARASPVPMPRSTPERSQRTHARTTCVEPMP
eukprot:6942095-Lingulodinium_polyedra.AAC.1